MEKQKVLIVDDEETIRVSLKSSLNKSGIHSDTAESGSIALEILKSDHYDIVLTDIMMDDVTGITLLKKVKERFPKIEVLLMTGYANIETAIEAVRLGASDYLVKPCTIKAILSSIKNCVEKRRLIRKKNFSQDLQMLGATLPGNKPLTKRELEVYRHLISGKSDKLIAEELDVTIATVKFHLKNIYVKYGINGRKGVLELVSRNQIY